MGGIITQEAGWRFIYAGTTVYALLVAILTFWKVKNDYHYAERGNFDMIGTALYALTLLSLMHGLSLIPDMTGAYLMALAGAIMLVFFRWELGHSNSVLKISIFRKNTVFTFSNLAALINYSATIAVGFLLSLYL